MFFEEIKNNKEICNKTNEGREINFYDGIIKTLKEETEKLSLILTNATTRGDMNLYIGTVKALRETLNLISIYDWKLDYSEYEVLDDNNNTVKQISIWEKNHDNQIRNHKFWNVINENGIVAKTIKGNIKGNIVVG
jgi:hypothetical protein